ncbi:MAG TPA: DUF4229 domain-containing protein [Nocardioidaceae bacterium]|nr:DUF4229 domain-containing protein [Nocardioidaceae bacterium]
MKEFAVYTALRLGLLASTFLGVFGVWAIFSDEVPVIWVLLIAAVLSSVLSIKFLAGPRDRLALKVEQRAQRASAKFEEMRSKEDQD